MTLPPGATLGPYEIVAALGAGGMGEVYRARDTRLDRTVAIKVLADVAGGTGDRRQRFEREARAVSSLNHPHICTLYDVGREPPSTGSGEAIDFLVIEHVEGETLAARLERGALPLDQALRSAREMAEALDHAHRRGVVHRDLKPSNVMLTRAGVKLLDFGLAKLRQAQAGRAGAPSLATQPLQQAPLTAQGTVLGTLHYMAPEQLEGKEVDARADLFAFGAILYEMVTGRKAFQAASPASVIAAILGTDPPPLSTVQPLAPAALDRLVRGCLAKDPDDRWQDARDLRRALDGISDESGQASRPSGGDAADEPNVSGSAREQARKRPGRKAGQSALLAGLAALTLGAALALWSSLPSTEPRPVVRSVIPIAPAEELAWGYESTVSPLVAISPDGGRVVYSGLRAGVRRLYLRALDRPEAEAIPGTEGAYSPFFSPNGHWVGFRVGAKIMKVALTGGAPLTLCPDCGGMGYSWSPDDTIVLGSGRRGLEGLSTAGAATRQLTAADEALGERTLRFPEVLPGAKAIVFTVGGWKEDTFDDARIEALTLASGKKSVLVEGGTHGRYASSGHLVYARAGSLFAVAFDPVGLEVKGAPVAVLEGVATHPSNGAAHFALSREGTLVYAAGRSMGIHHRLVWVDRRGGIEPLGDITGAFDSPRLSPDGQRIALRVEGGLARLEVYDVQRGTLTRLTFEENVPEGAAWSPDGRRLAYSWQRTGVSRMYWQPADGSAAPVELSEEGTVGSWLPDGKTLTFVRSDTGTGLDVWLLPLEGERTARPLLQERSDQRWPEISPDGRWIAYVSEESGRAEVYVRAFPGMGQKTQVSANGGDDPRWSRDGRELFYVEGRNRLMVSRIRAQPTLTASKATIAFEDRAGRYLKLGYDVAADRRFLLVDENENWPRQLNLVQNWLEEVERLVPR